MNDHDTNDERLRNWIPDGNQILAPVDLTASKVAAGKKNQKIIFSISESTI